MKSISRRPNSLCGFEVDESRLSPETRRELAEIKWEREELRKNHTQAERDKWHNFYGGVSGVAILGGLILLFLALGSFQWYIPLSNLDPPWLQSGFAAFLVLGVSLLAIGSIVYLRGQRPFLRKVREREKDQRAGWELIDRRIAALSKDVLRELSDKYEQEVNSRKLGYKAVTNFEFREGKALVFKCPNCGSPLHVEHKRAKGSCNLCGGDYFVPAKILGML